MRLNPGKTGEIWELIGVRWRFPIRVTWLDKDRAEVRLADIPSMLRQRRVVRSQLNRMSASHADYDYWIFSRAGLLQCSFHSRHKDPEDVVIWRGVDETETVPADFVMAYVNSRDAVLRDPIQFAAVWDSVCKFMLERLVFAEQPVDLGFAVLNALPVRADWKAALHKFFRRHAHNPETPRPDVALIQAHILGLLHQSAMTAWDEKNKIIRWSLDIAPTFHFHNAAKRVEIARKAGAKKQKYLLAVLNKLRGEMPMKEKLYDIFLASMREVDFPAKRLPRGSDYRDLPKTYALPGHRGAPIPRRYTGRIYPEAGWSLVPQNEGVPAVQDLQQVCPNVRHPRAVLDGARNHGRPYHATGLSLLHADKIRRRGELLAPQPDRGDDGLAQIPQQFPAENAESEPPTGNPS